MAAASTRPIAADATSARDEAFVPGFAAAFEGAFDYAGAFSSGALSDAIREDIPAAHRRAWARLARPGTWWTAEERVAIAAETRAAVYCPFCRERREALSPFSVEGEHAHVTADVLPRAAVDAVHRLVTDATRLSGSWIEGLAQKGVPDTHYVELLSIVVAIRSIDAFHRAMGLAPEPLPTPFPASETGAPSRKRPAVTETRTAWVPLIVPAKLEAENDDLFPAAPMVPNVIKALSLVPDGVRWLKDLSQAHYLPMAGGEMMDFSRGRGPLSRAQTELIAGRVSALNECFY
ncbi:MAG: hypothetical protein NXI30_00870 [bacterium]|nr:hypothetical protein [bacterium]